MKAKCGLFERKISAYVSKSRGLLHIALLQFRHVWEGLYPKQRWGLMLGHGEPFLTRLCIVGMKWQHAMAFHTFLWNKPWSREISSSWNNNKDVGTCWNIVEADRNLEISYVRSVHSVDIHICQYRVSNPCCTHVRQNKATSIMISSEWICDSQWL